MAKQSKNDATIRNALQKSGALQPAVAYLPRTRDPVASQRAAIVARRAEFANTKRVVWPDY